TQHASWREYARAAPATSSRRLRRAVPNDRPAPRPREGTRRTSFVSAPWTSSSSRTDRREAEQLYTALRARRDISEPDRTLFGPRSLDRGGAPQESAPLSPRLSSWSGC